MYWSLPSSLLRLTPIIIWQQKTQPAKAAGKFAYRLLPAANL
jgi:hypothetical protein